jgi:hypothetical protein
MPPATTLERPRIAGYEVIGGVPPRPAGAAAGGTARGRAISAGPIRGFGLTPRPGTEANGAGARVPAESGGGAPTPLIKNIRTYRSDVAEILARREASLASIALAEQERRAQEAPREAARRARAARALGVFGGALFLGLGGAALYYVFVLQPPVPSERPKTGAQTLLVADVTTGVDATGADRQKLIAEVRRAALGTPLPLGAIRHLSVTESETIAGSSNIAPQVVIRPISTARFFELLASSAPPWLVRALAPEFMYGTHALGTPHAFLLFKTAAYESAFAGLLEWENTMLDDIGPLLLLNPPQEASVPTPRPVNGAAAEATSTLALKEAESPGGLFRDAIMLNKDIRVARDAAGVPILFYSFLDRGTILIAAHELTLKEVLLRLQTRRASR